MPATQDTGTLRGPRQGALPPRSGHLLGGIVARGTALGSDAFIAQHVQQRYDSTCAQENKLAQLPLNPQTHCSVLHNCLHHSEAHLLRNI